MDYIQIKNLEVYCNHGVYEAENILGQKFLLDVMLYLDLRAAGLSDDLEQSVNYGEVCRFLTAAMKEENNQLLERVAERLCEGILLKFPLIDKVELTIKKPWAPVMMHIDHASVTLERSWHKVYVGIGTNMGDREAYIDQAIRSLSTLPKSRFLKTSSIIETEPYGYADQDPFLNTIAVMDVLYTPMELLNELQRMEQQAGRTREIHWGPRTLDLDLLLYDDLVTTDPVLVIPHPEIEKRAFVLESLCELDPYGVHPLLKQRYKQIYEQLINHRS